MRIPLQYQIMLPLASVSLASLLAVGLINARLATQETQSSIQQQLQGVVGVLANSNFPLTDAVLRQMRGLSGAEFVFLDDKERRISASLTGLTVPLPADHVIGPGGRVTLGPQITVGDRKYFHSSIRLPRPLGTTEYGVLHILFPRQQYDAVWRRSFLPPLLVAVVAVIAFALVTQWIANRLSRNLARLGTGVRRLAGGEFAPLELPHRDDEIRDLALAVNQTAARLSEYEEHVRQTEQMRTVAMLGAGLAHELRNAATGCRLAVDLHTEVCPAASDDDSLTVARSQLQLMESRLQSYLQLGKQDSLAPRERIELAGLVEAVLPLAEPAAKHAGVAFEWISPASPAIVAVDAGALRMVIVNLLLNAIEAAQKQASTSPESGHVWIRVAQDSPRFAELAIVDSGAGPPDSVAERLFDPFVSTKPEGVGLGLAVARQVAESHGGELACLREGQRTVFRLRLPLVAAEAPYERVGQYAEDSSCR